ncbi:ABC transporter permease [Amnibacterium flavum]|nr:ABC transporter permease subunit [Amnibacterium flavum]
MTTAAPRTMPGLSRTARHRIRVAAITLVVLAAWEVLGRFGLVAGGALPAPSAILEAWWADWEEYPRHILATVGTAAAGFAIGNGVAIVIAIATQLVPAIDRLIRPLVVVLFCLPVVVAAPILGIAFDDPWPKIALAVLLVFFPTLIATQVGLRGAPGDAVSVVRSAGGGALRALFLVRLRAAVPEILSGLQISAPAAVLGAILGEFIGGRWGLGIYLVGSISSGNPAIIWAIGLTATALSAILYGVLGLVRLWYGSTEKLLTLDLPSTRRVAGSALRKALERVGWLIAGLAVLIGAWYAFIASTGLPVTLMNSPTEVFNTLVTSDRAPELRAELGEAFLSSLSPAVIGSAAGILFAFVLATLFATFPSIGASAMPFAFISQTVPLVALAPLIALAFGRGPATVVAVTVSVTFFPSLVTIMQGLAGAPSGPLDVLRSVNAGRFAVLSKVVVPNAVPHLLASVRLAVPRALTGVLIAEQLITGTGLGGLLSQARGYLDYRLMWAIAVVVAVFSLIVYGLAQLAEDGVLKRRR